jgi:AraC-like DNA-binding protein
VKETYQCSPQAYIKQIRLTKANDLLQQRQGSISEVAYAVGFNSVSYFNRAYKEQFDKTPSALN